MQRARHAVASPPQRVCTVQTRVHMATSVATGGALLLVLAEALGCAAVFGGGGPPQAAKRIAVKAAGNSAWRIRVMERTLPRSPLRRDPDARKK
jgi:hypothetical protein